MTGIDEVGRGAWAGPLLVVAARAKSKLPVGIADSKKLNKPKREELALKLLSCCEIGMGWVTVSELNKIGLAEGLRLGTSRALKKIQATVNEKIIIDGKVNLAPQKFINVAAIVKADQQVPIVSAASIVAKVTRDALMRQTGKRHAGYGFQNHVGYGTAQHQKALAELGPINDIHRKSFKPLKELSAK